MTGIEYFLTKELYSKNEHNGCDKYAYDDENIHYTLLHLLCIDSKQFTKHFLNLDSLPTDTQVIHQPERKLFDLLFKIDNKLHYYCEIKVWDPLKETQLEKQITFLKKEHAKNISAIGVHVLLPKPVTSWTKEYFKEYFEKFSFEEYRYVTINDLIEFIRPYKADDDSKQPAAAQEVAKAYLTALEDLAKNRGY